MNTSSDTPFFSIVIPAYNAERTIVATIESCRAQSDKDFEVIVVDDASKDNTVAVIEHNYREYSQLQLISLPANGGPSKARNTGIAAAKGRYIAFLDADDTWHSNKLEICKAILTQNPDRRFLFHNYTTNDLLTTELQKIPAVHKYAFAKLLLRNVAATPCVIMANSKDLHFNENMKYCEDYDLFLRYIYTYGAYHLPLQLTKIGRPILSKGGQSAAHTKMRLGEMKAYLNLINLNFLFVFLVPFLCLWSLLKHLRKQF